MSSINVGTDLHLSASPQYTLVGLGFGWADRLVGVDRICTGVVLGVGQAEVQYTKWPEPVLWVVA